MGDHSGYGAYDPSARAFTPPALKEQPPDNGPLPGEGRGVLAWCRRHPLAIVLAMTAGTIAAIWNKPAGPQAVKYSYAKCMPNPPLNQTRDRTIALEQYGGIDRIHRAGPHDGAIQSQEFVYPGCPGGVPASAVDQGDETQPAAANYSPSAGYITIDQQAGHGPRIFADGRINHRFGGRIAPDSLVLTAGGVTLATFDQHGVTGAPIAPDSVGGLQLRDGIPCDELPHSKEVGVELVWTAGNTTFTARSRIDNSDGLCRSFVP